MADDGRAQSNTTWPLVKFSFSVKFDGMEGLFQEVTGLSSEEQVIEYRSKSSLVFSAVKMPGLQKFGNVTLKKGAFNDKTTFAKWRNNFSAVKKQTVTIALLDEANEPAMTWTLVNAFPSKITVTDMKEDGNEVAVETMEIAHEGLKTCVGLCGEG